MNTSNDVNTVELLDDIDNLLFLCDRLSHRLNQVNSYVDEVKQTWINKRRSIEFDSNMSPIVAQKVSKYNKVLLSVAEKLAIVELQTESLHNLQSSVTNLLSTSIEKHDDTSSTSAYSQMPTYSTPSTVQMNHTKNGIDHVGSVTQRDLFSGASRSTANDQRANLSFQNSSISTFTARNSATLFSETASVKQPLVEQQSAFRRPPAAAAVASTQQPLSFNPPRSSSQSLLISQTPQKSISHAYQPAQSSSNTLPPRSSAMSDSFSSLTLNDSNIVNGKFRVKMQLIKAGIVWHNADIPIIDHPSAFFVCNQDPRVAEHFHMMSMEMNNYYNKSTNTTIPLQNPAIGDFCVARFSEDNHWYRARIVLIHGNDSILIVFIDYGNSETKPANEIYPLNESLIRLPAMTVACTLAEAFPRNENFWTTEATDIFNQLVKNRIVEVHFQSGSGQQWPLHFVKIMLDGQSISQHPKLSPYITSVRNEQIAMHFNDKLTSMEYILYNVAVIESDIYNGSLP